MVKNLPVMQETWSQSLVGEMFVPRKIPETSKLNIIYCLY